MNVSEEDSEKGNTMQFLQGFLMVSSVLFLSGMSAYALSHKKRAGAVQVSLLGIFAVIWTIGSFFEMNSQGLEQKLLWRNIQQIGVFGLPVCTLGFAFAYTGSKRFPLFIQAIYGIAAFIVLLVWTDSIHHILRAAYFLKDSAVFGQTLIVKSTFIGTMVVAYNFSLPLLAIFVLLRFARNVSTRFRRQVYWIIGCFAATFAAAFLRTAYFDEWGIYVHISVLFIPNAAIMFHSLFHFNFFKVSPIARDKVFEVIDQGILVTDNNGIVLEANAAAKKIIKELLKADLHLSDTRITDIFWEYGDLHAMLSGSADGKQEIELPSNTNQVYLSLEYYPLMGGKDGSVLIINNVTKQKTYEQHLLKQAEVDALTGLLNRSGFERTFEDMRIFTQDRQRPLSLFMIDLDNFKMINDTYGHPFGDKVLVQFAAVLRSVLREEDVTCRIGGEEFAVLLPGVKKEEAAAIAERIRVKVSNAVLTYEGKDVGYTVSIGVTDNCLENSCTYASALSDMIKQADSAMYQAKKSGKNHTVIYGES